MANKSFKDLIKKARGRFYSPSELAKLESSPSWVETCKAFRKEVFDPESVLYPCCGFDSSPGMAFDNIVFVDINNGGNKGCIDALNRAGFNAIDSDIRNYVPAEKHDTLILASPCIPSKWATPHIITGGYVLSNDYHSNASQLFNLPREFRLIASANESNDSTFSRAISGLFTPVKSLDELKETSPERYESIVGLMDSFFKSYSGRERTGNLDRDYLLMRKSVYGDKTLPYKRKAEVYVFQKLEDM